MEHDKGIQVGLLSGKWPMKMDEKYRSEDNAARAEDTLQGTFSTFTLQCHLRSRVGGSPLQRLHEWCIIIDSVAGNPSKLYHQILQHPVKINAGLPHILDILSKPQVHIVEKFTKLFVM